ncbi:acetyl-CoA acetyltransferase [Malikia spinosa]|uniref:Acetyl-CoA acetyltransferase n=1 Tax=Malikia spinosa TaxID=86180 RepID=A0A2S9KAT0_9BURK|nr:thiolase domain-containing protein [Malikia spinosa]OGB70147.1 MAG: acetyl-CoA acetyltransferase [Burkholderiales bacterium RIFOXYC12_FULL_65_23]PRD67540.1 acetyl-CoA acetyltransferase [Malikia spinosa]
MSLNGKAAIVGAYEHPTRLATNLSVLRLHADVAKGALEDAGLSKSDIDGYFCAGDAPGLGTATVAEYLGLKLRHVDSTECGGSAPILHVAHAAEAIAAGRCNIALVTLAGRPRAMMEEARAAAAAAAQAGQVKGPPKTALKAPDPDAPELAFELPYGPATQNLYAMVAKRHMHEFGTTAEQLAWIKVAASHHAQHNPNAMLRKVVTVDDVVGSPLVSDPLHRLDCCVMSDGGGALIVARPEIARELSRQSGRPLVMVRGTGEALKHGMGGQMDLSYSAAAWSGPLAFAEAGLTAADIQYASLYDSFTITVLMQLEDLGFCRKGEGGRFVMDGNLISGVGKLPFNTDGGGLCNNHPANRGGMTKVIEAVRQLRGEAHPAVQVPNCTLALANGIGGALASRHTAGTLILERV